MRTCRTYKNVLVFLTTLTALSCVERIFDNPTDPAVVLKPPANLAITSMTEQEATLTWEDPNDYGSYPKDRVQYQIERSSNCTNFQLMKTVPGGATTTVVPSTYVSTTTYTFRIRIGAGSKVTGYAANTANLSFPAPTNLQVTSISETAASLQWTLNNTHATKVLIERSTNSLAGYVLVDSVASTQTSKGVVGVYRADTVYYFRVRATSTLNTSGYSSSASRSYVFPSPTNLQATSITETQAALQWSLNNSQATKVLIERSTYSLAGYVLVDSVASTQTSKLVSGVYRTDTTFYFRAWAVSSVNTSGRSSPAPATLSFPAPSGLTVSSLTSTQAQLQWQDNSNFETGFEIRWGVDSTSLAATQTVPANATSAAITGFFDTTSTYYFRVRAVSANNQSRYSNTAMASRALPGLTVEWVSVPAGPYTYGNPATTQTISYNYQIMKYDVTNAQYLAYLNAALAAGRIIVSGSSVQGTYTGDAQWPAGTYTFYSLGDNTGGAYKCGRIKYQGGAFSLTPDASYQIHPVVYVTWFGAWAFANFYGLRLPTEEEWEKAARGNTGYNYPWGNSITAQNANYRQSGDPFSEGTTPVGYYDGQSHGGFGTTNSPSPYGAYDMAGNVWQWTNSFYGGSYPTYRVLRGGSWYNYTNGLQGWNRNNAYPTYSYDNFGFRCARTF